MSSKYLQSIQEVRQWLSYKRLDEFIYILLDNGYDDLDSISQCSRNEMILLEDLFATEDTKLNIQILVDSLRSVGIDAYRKQKNEFRRLIAGTGGSSINRSSIAAAEANLGLPAFNNIIEETIVEIDPAVAAAEEEKALKALQDQQLLLEQQQLLLAQSQSATISKTGYCAVRSDPSSAWADKYVVLEGTQLRWYTSRRDTVAEVGFELIGLLLGVDKPDPTTIVLSLTQNGCIELGYDNPEETDEWFLAFASVIPVAQQALLMAQQQQQIAQQREELKSKPKRTSTIGSTANNNSAVNRSSLAAPEANNRSTSIQSNKSTSSSFSTAPTASSVPSGPATFSSVSADLSDSKYDVNTWDGAVNLHAYYRAKLALARTVLDPVNESELERDILGIRGESLNLKRLRKFLKTLNDGCQFKKFKRGNSTRRLIWCTPLFDYILWGSDDKLEIKGFITTNEIQEINQGFGKNQCRLYIVSPSRTLELEAKDATTAKEWKALLEFLIQSNSAELGQKKYLYSLPGMNEAIITALKSYTILLNSGEIFKKWPASHKLQKGSYTNRKVWISNSMDRLQWGDIVTNKVMGFLLMEDIVYIAESDDPLQKLKFTIQAQKRALDLEAKSVFIKEKWVRALRFFLEFKQKK